VNIRPDEKNQFISYIHSHLPFIKAVLKIYLTYLGALDLFFNPIGLFSGQKSCDRAVAAQAH
jgi:hypothetical protein